jgi:hypothetical protein
LLDINTDTSFFLEKFTRLFHIYSKSYAIPSFNDSGLGCRRFDPFSVNNKVMPSFYCATDSISAVAEVILRLNNIGQRHIVADINNRGLLEFDLKRNLKLVDLTQFKEINNLLSSSNCAYQNLTTIAKAIAINHPEVDGLSWFGYQKGERGLRCFLFFGDRVSVEDFETKIESNFEQERAVRILKDAALALNTDIGSGKLLI